MVCPSLQLDLPPGSHTSVGERQEEQQFCNIITIFHIATTSQQGGRREVCVCVSRGYPQSPEREGEETKGGEKV